MKGILKNSLLLLMALCLLTLTVSGKGTKEKSAKSPRKFETTQKLPKLLDLGASKCTPCKRMAPILAELTNEYKVHFAVEFIDVWQPENKEIAMAHGIQSIPTQIFFDANGKELWRHEGFISKEDILYKWKELGFSFRPVKENTRSRLD